MSSALQLEQIAKQLGVPLDPEQRQQLLDYLALMQRWSTVYNLTAVRDIDEMLTLHLADSLAVVAPLRREIAGLPHPIRLLDVGAGAGLPGVVLAICCPELSVTCVDAVGKKAAFIQQVAVSLKLHQLRGLHARVENLDDAYDVVCSRAFSSLTDFTRWSVAALAPHGTWLAMKGKYPSDELAGLPATVNVFHVEPLQVPGLDAERCIVWMKNAPVEPK